MSSSTGPVLQHRFLADRLVQVVRGGPCDPVARRRFALLARGYLALGSSVPPLTPMHLCNVCAAVSAAGGGESESGSGSGAGAQPWADVLLAALREGLWGAAGREAEAAAAAVSPMTPRRTLTYDEQCMHDSVAAVVAGCGRGRCRGPNPNPIQ